jgi:hypothetical protein
LWPTPLSNWRYIQSLTHQSPMLLLLHQTNYRSVSPSHPTLPPSIRFRCHHSPMDHPAQYKVAPDGPLHQNCKLCPEPRQQLYLTCTFGSSRSLTRRYLKVPLVVPRLSTTRVASEHPCGTLAHGCHTDVVYGVLVNPPPAHRPIMTNHSGWASFPTSGPI